MPKALQHWIELCGWLLDELLEGADDDYKGEILSQIEEKDLKIMGWLVDEE